MNAAQRPQVLTYLYKSQALSNLPESFNDCRSLSFLHGALRKMTTSIFDRRRVTVYYLHASGVI